MELKFKRGEPKTMEKWKERKKKKNRPEKFNEHPQWD